MPSPSFVSLHKTAVISKEICLYSFPRDKATSFGPAEVHLILKRDTQRARLCSAISVNREPRCRSHLDPESQYVVSMQMWAQAKKKCVFPSVDSLSIYRWGSCSPPLTSWKRMELIFVLWENMCLWSGVSEWLQASTCQVINDGLGGPRVTAVFIVRGPSEWQDWDGFTLRWSGVYTGLILRSVFEQTALWIGVSKPFCSARMKTFFFFFFLVQKVLLQYCRQLYRKSYLMWN